MRTRHTPNYAKALDILAWLRTQPVAENNMDQVRAAAIAAHMNAKDDTISRLIRRAEDLGYPRGEDTLDGQ